MAYVLNNNLTVTGTLNVNTGANILNSNTLIQSGNGIGVNAGTISLLGGTSNTGTGGAITITGGNNTSSGSGGDVTITAGNSNSVPGGSIILNPGSGSTAGEVVVNGKLTVTGLIDPTGMVFEEQAATPYDPTATTQGTLWVRDDNPNVIVFTDNVGTDTVLTGADATPTLTQVLAAGNTTGGHDIEVFPASAITGQNSGMTGGTLLLRGGTGTQHGGDVTVQGQNATTGLGGDVVINAGNTIDPALNGGGIFITGGDVPSTSPAGTGGNITIRGGANTGASGGGTGGNIVIEGGESTNANNGGDVTITAGSGGAVTGDGGNLALAAGPVPTSGNGGAVTITATNGGTSGLGGNVVVSSGDTLDGSNNAGVIYILGGDTNSTTVGGVRGNIFLIAGNNTGASGGGIAGSVNLSAGEGTNANNGGDVIISGGSGGPVSGDGGDVTITAGNGPTSGIGGTISLTAGTGTSTDGDITFDANGAAAPIPINSAADPDLNTTAQNIVGAINEILAGGGAARATYTLLSVQYTVNNTSQVVVAYFSWVASRYSGFSNGRIIFEAATISTSALQIQVRDVTNAVDMLALTNINSNSFNNLALSNLPGVSNARIEVRLNRVVGPGTKPTVYNINIEFDI